MRIVRFNCDSRMGDLHTSVTVLINRFSEIPFRFLSVLF